MIRMRIDPAEDSDSPPMFLHGITDANVEKLTSGFPLIMELEQLDGPRVSVVLFHGKAPEQIAEQLREILDEEQMAAVEGPLAAWAEQAENGDEETLEEAVRRRCAEGGHQLVGSTCPCGENRLGQLGDRA